MKKKTILTIADSIKKFDPMAETTSFILLEAQGRGYINWVCELDDLFLENRDLKVWARQVKILRPHKKIFYQVVSEKRWLVKNFDIVLLRKDPPVDQKFMDHLTLLEMVEKSTKAPLFINSPSGIKKASEKIYPFYFKGISPPSLVSSNRKEMARFIERYKKVVLKPLNLSGGRGIRVIQAVPRPIPLNYVLLQKYLPAVTKGDKRILLLDGKVLGAFLRVPKKGDFRGNMHSGASWVKCTVTDKEKKMIRQIRGQLKQDGLSFVGIDVIGGYVTEINSTSPMGIREINELYGGKVEGEVVDYVASILNQ